MLLFITYHITSYHRLMTQFQYTVERFEFVYGKIAS